MVEALKNFWVEEDGQDLVEYALLIGFVAIAAVAGLTAMATNIGTIWTNINTKLTSAASYFPVQNSAFD
jgi:pilus assembly protein Flp/PilA